MEKKVYGVNTTSFSNGNINRKFFDYAFLWVKGFCMGAADVVPGVSGGTMAFILGIYEELLDAIKSFDLKSLKMLASGSMKEFMEHIRWKFLVALGAGILCAIFSLSKMLSWLLNNQPVLIWSFFFGLVISSAFGVSRQVRQWNVTISFSVILGMAAAYILVGLVPAETPNAPWFLFLSGAIAICAMILPGISGSFVLVLMGKYFYVLEAVNKRDFITLFFVAGGAVLGIMAFARLLKWMLGRYHDLMVAILIGLMLGSLRKVWPWKETLDTIRGLNGKIIPVIQLNILPSQWNGEVFAALSLMLAGFLIVFFLEKTVKKANQNN